MVAEDVMGKVKEMAEAEERYAKELRELAGRFRHPVLQALIMGIAQDSLKHAVFYRAVHELLSRVQPMLSEEELEIIRTGIARHIKMEEEMVKLSGRLAEEAGDPRLKLIFRAVYEDEMKHHSLLVLIREKIAESETFTEEDLWDAVWRDSPWHGAPGG